ncbi:MAG TPA: patatin-like phospholipase family protein [Solirubrobacteraceae bacterium]|nr:patatin-like phospholipase family protein [Solirubrobacteraceae bacterium]
MQRPFDILSIDGGGIRGIIPATVLAELERRTGRRIAELFDLIAGTSTGGILAVALTVPGEGGIPRWRAEELIGLYVEQGPEIFARTLGRTIASGLGLLDERYDDAALEAALDRYVGDARLSELATDVLVTAYDTEARRPFLFASHVVAEGEPAWDHRARDAARATAAAPTYFEPLALSARGERFCLVDGAVFANNPALSAYAEARRIAPERPVRIVSLGTGSLNRPYRCDAVRGWGVVEWIRPLIDVVFDGQSAAVAGQLDQLLGDDHHRFQIELIGAKDELDDVSPENLAALGERGRSLVEGDAGRLDAVARALLADR